MRISAETYLRSAESHISAGWDLHSRSWYVLSHYVAGLSVECVFRAYRSRIDPQFSGRHDLNVLFDEARFAEILPSDRAARESHLAAIDHLRVYWSNTYRFCSTERLLSHLKKMRLYSVVKSRGDDALLRNSSKKMLTDASAIVSLGVKKWTW